MSKNGIVAALDVGTSKITVLVGQPTEEGLSIIGVGVHPSKGVKDGVVLNIEETAGSIRKAVEDAELMADVEVESVFVGISGTHIQCTPAKGEVSLSDGVVKRQDVSQAVDVATAITVHSDREIIHILPVEFAIDGHRGIKEPIGMSGRKLEVRVLIITAMQTHIKNLISSCRRAGLRVSEAVLSSLASSDAVLTPDEKELGVCLVDIGGGTTNVAVFHGGAVEGTFEIPLGGRHITRDLAAGLRTTLAEAERVKKEFGSAVLSNTRKDEEVEIAPLYSTGTVQRVSRRHIAEIIIPRTEEILEFVDEHLEKNGLRSLLGAGVVLTGGSSQLPGLPELAEEMLGLPVRIGSPSGLSGLMDVVDSPSHSTSVGLLLAAYRQSALGDFQDVKVARSGAGVVKKIKRFFEQIL